MLNTITGLLSPSGVPTDYESIATTTVGAGGTPSITFSSIPSTYTHLQIRGIGKYAVTGDTTLLRINSDTGNNYTRHRLTGTGSAATAAGSGTNNSLVLASDVPTATSTFGAVIIDILDYANTNKYKTFRSLTGHETNSAGVIELKSGLWINTSAITTILLYPSAGNFEQYSSFALYGIK